MECRPAPAVSHRAVRIAALLALTLAAAPAFGWGELGHRVVAELAEQALTPQARSAVDRLLEGEPERGLASVATWPDRIRDEAAWKHTAPWHYLNFPDGAGCQYWPERDCRGGNCVVGAITSQLDILQDRSRPSAQRAEALKFLVHFVGDVHQPMHAGHAHDKGGNDFQVQLALPGGRSEGTNLHSVWDRWLLTTHEDDWRTYARELAAEGLITSERDRLRDPAARWAEESCRIMREPGVYPRRHKLGTTYLERWRPTVEKRLRQAAGRLAWLLNEALGK